MTEEQLAKNLEFVASFRKTLAMTDFDFTDEIIEAAHEGTEAMLER